MILTRAANLDDRFLAADHEPPCFVVVWTTGPDTTIDGVVRILARRRTRAGTIEEFDRWCDPRDGTGRAISAESTWSDRFGRTAEELVSAPIASECWRELQGFVGESPVVVPDGPRFRAWGEHLVGRAPTPGAITSLSALAALLFPGKLAQRREGLLAALVEPTHGEGTESYGPEDLEIAVDELARRFLQRDESVQRLAVLALRRAWDAFAATDPAARRALALTLALVEHRERWAGREDPRTSARGPLAALLRAEVSIDDLIEEVEPRCTRELDRWRDLEAIPADDPGAERFHPDDQRVLDDVFERRLPESFGAARNYRKSQHEVARAVAGALGTKELLLVHAPTGTGKTLAYLVPALLWSRRYSVRVGVATYTRALQEQAMEREVPRALSALSSAGVVPGTRVCVLKGRDNYLCWRALKLAVPTEDEGGETWLAWSQLALFALTDLEADFDRMPLVAPIALEDESAYVNTLTALVRHSRSQVGCCSAGEDRATCGAEVARQRAQKCHVVIVNQAFALARQEFFRHAIFDECEHLHEQAHSAWSHSIGLREMKSLLGRLSHPPHERSRALLDRLARTLLEGTPSHATVTQCLGRWSAASAALTELDRTARAFDAWRVARARERDDRDAHSLLREYFDAAHGELGGTQLLAARESFVAAWTELETQLSELAERLDGLPLRGLPRLRRTLGEARAELVETLDAVVAWLPVDEGRPAFRPRTFHDVERDARGELVLASRVLLPNEFLGRGYYPQLSSGIFLSATTFLQDGFTASMGYLGLDRAAQPSEDEERAPCVVRTFRAPEVFDYSRVLVAVPRDAPPAGGDKDAFLDYVRRFVAHLGERTRGRMLVLFTNSMDAVRVGEELTGFFDARAIPLWFQNMEGRAKEELGELFRARVDSILMGVDTFWYGADFPGETLEYLVIVKLPYGVPDRYHHAQCAVLGAGDQRQRIYLPRALAKFRQGFGRLMRRESDRGCVFVLDGRVLEPRHRHFLRELPIERPFDFGPDRGSERRARFVRAETDRCIREALAHMDLVEDVKRRGLDWSFPSAGASAPTTIVAGNDGPASDGIETLDTPVPPMPKPAVRRDSPTPMDVPLDDLPY